MYFLSTCCSIRSAPCRPSWRTSTTFRLVVRGVRLRPPAGRAASTRSKSWRLWESYSPTPQYSSSTSSYHPSSLHSSSCSFSGQKVRAATLERFHIRHLCSNREFRLVKKVQVKYGGSMMTEDLPRVSKSAPLDTAPMSLLRPASESCDGVEWN